MISSGNQTAGESQTNLKRVRLQLCLISLIGLFCELLLIRWLSTEVRIFAYFKNIPLMSAFLGLGLGFMWAGHKRDYFKFSGIVLLYLSGILMCALALGWTHISFMLPGSNTVFMGHSDAHPFGIAILLSIFAISVFLFVGLGQRTARLFAQLKPLEAYSWNVCGGLAGILLFTALSYFGTDPGVWLAVAGVLLLAFERRLIFAALIVLGLSYSLCLAPYIARQAYAERFVKSCWSPYYRIDVVEDVLGGKLAGRRLGYDLFVNYDGFQAMSDASAQTLAFFPSKMQNFIVQFHSKPFMAFGKKPNNVLILGAGSGSDVAAALRAGASHVDAVEIDPAIFGLGKVMHPERPYDSERVSVHLMDARTFLKQAHGRYDVIAFALLDSHSGFSSLSSLRMDNYIFTEESIREASKLLTDRGIITLCFVSVPDWLWARQSSTLARATGQNPVGFFSREPLPMGMLIAGPGINGKKPEDMNITWPPRAPELNSKMPVPTDDWPFLFLPEKAIPLSYLNPMLVILAMASLPLLNQLKNGRPSSFNAIMLLLGVGFMLQEVRSMANLSLLFGSTWVVNSVIISAVMIFILAANWLAMRTSARHLPAIFGCLLASLLVSTCLDAGKLAQMGLLWGTLTGCLIFLLPLIFASAVFSLLFKDVKDSTSALAFNLFGGVVGIAMEYFSMWLGIGFLGWIALAIYLVVFGMFFLCRPSSIITQVSAQV